MILAIDMGSNNIVIGGIDDSRTWFVERVTTRTWGRRTWNTQLAIKDIMAIHNLPLSSIEGAVVSSVVPPLTDVVLSAVKKIAGDAHAGWLRHENGP